MPPPPKKTLPRFKPGPCKVCKSKKQPTFTVIWADGRGITRLCEVCIKKWKKEPRREIVAVLETDPKGKYA